MYRIKGQVRIITFHDFREKESVFHSTQNSKSFEKKAYCTEISLKGFLKPEICHIFENSEHSGRKIQWTGSSPVDRITLSYRHFPLDQKSRFHFRKFPVVTWMEDQLLKK